MRTAIYAFGLRTLLTLAALVVVAPVAPLLAQLAEAPIATSEKALPVAEGEFFNDFSGKVDRRDNLGISRTLRIAAESSRVHPMLVVINKMSDYPTLPQEKNQFAAKLAEEWKVGDVKTKRGVIVIFALDDHKYMVKNTGNLPQAVADEIGRGFAGRTLAELKEGNVTKAMKLAADVVATSLPPATAAEGSNRSATGAAPTATKTVTRTVRTRPGMGAPVSAPFSSTTSTPAAIQPNPQQHASAGSGYAWIGLLIVGGIFLFIVMALISMVRGSSHGYGPGAGGGNFGGGGYGGYGGGGGGFLTGMLTGGLLGYMFSGSHWGSGWGGSAYGADHSGLSDTTTTETWSTGGGDSSYGGGDSGGGFDSFGGGTFDGGGSFGEW